MELIAARFKDGNFDRPFLVFRLDMQHQSCVRESGVKLFMKGVKGPSTNGTVRIEVVFPALKTSIYKER